MESPQLSSREHYVQGILLQRQALGALAEKHPGTCIEYGNNGKLTIHFNEEAPKAEIEASMRFWDQHDVTVYHGSKIMDPWLNTELDDVASQKSLVNPQEEAMMIMSAELDGLFVHISKNQDESLEGEFSPVQENHTAYLRLLIKDCEEATCDLLELIEKDIESQIFSGNSETDDSEESQAGDYDDAKSNNSQVSAQSRVTHETDDGGSDQGILDLDEKQELRDQIRGIFNSPENQGISWLAKNAILNGTVMRALIYKSFCDLDDKDATLDLKDSGRSEVADFESKLYSFLENKDNESALSGCIDEIITFSASDQGIYAKLSGDDASEALTDLMPLLQDGVSVYGLKPLEIERVLVRVIGELGIRKYRVVAEPGWTIKHNTQTAAQEYTDSCSQFFKDEDNLKILSFIDFGADSLEKELGNFIKFIKTKLEPVEVIDQSDPKGKMLRIKDHFIDYDDYEYEHDDDDIAFMKGLNLLIDEGVWAELSPQFIVQSMSTALRKSLDFKREEYEYIKSQTADYESLEKKCKNLQDLNYGLSAMVGLAIGTGMYYLSEYLMGDMGQ